MKAIILAAGRGTRLSPITDELPKCLVQVNGKPILQYQLEAIERVHIRDCVVVLGHLGDQVQNRFGSNLGHLNITYLWNTQFLNTNNIYSLWLAKDELNEDTLLIEGDIVFKHSLLKDIPINLEVDIAIVDKFGQGMDGTVILTEDGIATNMVLKVDQKPDFNYQEALKTVNIYAFTKRTMTRYIMPTLDKYIKSGRTRIFYEAVLSELIFQGNISLVPVLAREGEWAEIDTKEDLFQAQKLFIC